MSVLTGMHYALYFLGGFIMRKFECEKCGSGKLAYQKYVKCVSPVEMDENNNMTYSKASTLT